MNDRKTLSRLRSCEHMKNVELEPTTGGHMNYYRAIASFPDGKRYFIKEHDDTMFSDLQRAAHSRAYLRKEHAVYQQLATAQFSHLPTEVQLHDDTRLVMEALRTQDSWHWQRPDEPIIQERYIIETLKVLRELESHDIASLPSFSPDINDSFSVLTREGWDCYLGHEQEIITALRTSKLPAAAQLYKSLPTLYQAFCRLPASDPTAFAHHDLRQSNLAWHPDHGVKLIDWSWAGAGTPGTDTTSFLIDIAKSGVDVTTYLPEYFDPRHALILIGFWLEHSTWPTPTTNKTVRIHQLASAIAAYQLYARTTTV